MPMDEQSRKQEIEAYFNGIVAPDYGVDARFFPAMGRQLVARARLAAGWRVLDVAAGRGAVLFPAVEAVGPRGHVTGIDLAEALVRETNAEIRRLGLDNARMRQMDAESLDFPPASFEAVLCGFALFFFPALERALAEFRRVLVPGGVFAATTFGPTDERMGWYEDLLKEFAILPAIPVTQELDDPAQLRAALAAAGFEAVEVLPQTYDALYADEQAWWERLWASGARAGLESLSPQAELEFKTRAFEHIRALKRPDGIHRPYKVLFTLAARPRA